MHKFYFVLFSVLLVFVSTVGIISFSFAKEYIVPQKVGKQPILNEQSNTQLKTSDLSAKSNSRIQWEHTCLSPKTMVITVDKKAKQLTQLFNQYGQQGWELAGFQIYTGRRKIEEIICFKRPITH